MSDANTGPEGGFGDALERTDPDVRATLLTRACGGDDDLRRKVEALLAAHQPAGGAGPVGGGRPAPATPPELDTEATRSGGPPEAAVDPDSTRVSDGPARRRPGPPRDEGVGSVIAGRYTLTRVIGKGGMGAVYLAQQTEPVRRAVALKLIRGGTDSKEVLARFEAERQALALMDHPNIARVYDGGVTGADGSGQPFFVMELVDGVSLTEYCDANRLPVAARLELFVRVCQAVQHAHQKGVIHRDLKPGNVLVTEVDGRPTPKVIDFGVAKATDLKLTDLSFTDVGAVVGTPAYMSPEQADPTAADIDTRTDVYALGVMLYELLVGSLPIDANHFKRGAVLEMLRMVREVEPPRPSTKLTTAATRRAIAANRNSEPARLANLLKGELDWVVLKALEKDRTRRYDTATALARDVQRYLADEVVEARPPSRWYEARKFVRRNRGPVLAAGLVLVALVAGVVGTSWGLVRARAAERLAGDRLVQVERARVETAEALTASEQARTRAEDAHTQVQRARAETEAALGESERARVKAEDARKQAAAVADYLVDAFRKPDPAADGRQLKVVDLLEKAADKAATDKAIAPPTRARLQDALGQTFFGLGLLERAAELQERAAAGFRSENGPDAPDTLAAAHRLSVTLGHAGRNAEAIRLGEDVLARRTAVLGPDAPDTLVTMIQLGGRYWTANRLDDAIRITERGVAGQRKVLGPESDDLPNSIANLGMLYQAAGRTAEAVRLHEEAVARRTAKDGPNHPETLLAMNFLGRAYEESGRTADALAIQKDTVARMEEAFGPDHPRTLAAMSKLVGAYYRSGRAADALSVGERALRLARGAKAPDAEAVLAAMEDVALTYSTLGRSADAVALLRDTVAAATTRYGPNHDLTLRALHNLGVTLRQADKPADAVPVFERALAAQRATRPESDSGMQRTISQLASAYQAVERAADAVRLLEQLLAVQKARLDPDHRDLLVTMANLGLSYGSVGRTGDAVRMHEAVVAAFRKKFGPKHPDTQTVTQYLADAYRDDDRLAAAETTYRTLLAAARPTLPADSPDLARCLFGLGTVLALERKFGEAEAALRECLKIRRQVAPDDWRTFATESLLGGSLLGQKKYADAEPLLRAGYAGLKAREPSIPPPSRARIRDALDRLIELSAATSKPDEAARWRAERAKYPDAAPPPREKK